MMKTNRDGHSTEFGRSQAKENNKAVKKIKVPVTTKCIHQLPGF